MPPIYFFIWVTAMCNINYKRMLLDVVISGSILMAFSMGVALLLHTLLPI